MCSFPDRNSSQTWFNICTGLCVLLARNIPSLFVFPWCGMALLVGLINVQTNEWMNENLIETDRCHQEQNNHRVLWAEKILLIVQIPMPPRLTTLARRLLTAQVFFKNQKGKNKSKLSYHTLSVDTRNGHTGFARSFHKIYKDYAGCLSTNRGEENLEKIRAGLSYPHGMLFSGL